MAVNDRENEGSRANEAEAQIARLYRQAFRDEPPAHLDRAIAAAARRSGEDTVRTGAGSRWAFWRLPFAAAALAVITASVVTLMIEREVESPPTVSAPRQPATEGEPAATDFQTAQTAKAAPEQSHEAGAPPARQPQASSRGEPPEVAHPPLRERAVVEPAAGARARPQADSPHAPQAPVSDAASAPSRAAASASSNTEAKPELREKYEAFSIPAQSPPERPAAAAAAPAPPSQSAPAAPAAAAPPLESVPAPRGMAEMRITPRGAPAPNLARHLSELDQQAPSAWIERILALRREGRTIEADALLAEFKRRYPYESLPEALR